MKTKFKKRVCLFLETWIIYEYRVCVSNELFHKIRYVKHIFVKGCTTDLEKEGKISVSLIRPDAFNSKSKSIQKKASPLMNKNMLHNHIIMTSFLSLDPFPIPCLFLHPLHSVLKATHAFCPRVIALAVTNAEYPFSQCLLLVCSFFYTALAHYNKTWKWQHRWEVHCYGEQRQQQ